MAHPWHSCTNSLEREKYVACAQVLRGDNSSSRQAVQRLDSAVSLSQILLIFSLLFRGDFP
ncbi:hypothetical protein L484_026959 [Morus notabilis]|uniref:Uncharacterized protein n=1 Tax=Morus notabilis TaxID=981085 RepID=W9R9A4_9ROSA|nr:hypothetical protein L484_026959 [Morus notabilis]